VALNAAQGLAWGGRVWLVGAVLVVLALAAIFYPGEPLVREDGTMLALLPDPDPRRREALADLAAYLGEQAALELRLQVTTDVASFRAALPGAVVVFCPDALALALPSSAWQALAAGRRRVPWNLRPTSVLVSRRSAPATAAPWLTTPGRTVFGDSLSLVCLAPLCKDGAAPVKPAGVGWGRDPYDHRPVLAAAAHGAYDHAVVRQWEAEAALAGGGLDPDLWQVRRLSDPVPDVVLLVARRLPAAARLDLQEALTMLGRDPADANLESRLVRAQLGLLGLDGFNLLLGPDVERLRRQHGRCWPGAGD
jgi:hypothetical protein